MYVPYVHQKTQIRKFIIVLFTLTVNWKQHKRPSVVKWIKKLKYIHMPAYYIYSVATNE